MFLKFANDLEKISESLCASILFKFAVFKEAQEIFEKQRQILCAVKRAQIKNFQHYCKE